MKTVSVYVKILLTRGVIQHLFLFITEKKGNKMTDTALNNPLVTAVMAVKSGENIVAVSSSNPLPVANAGYHYSVTGKTNADGVVTLTATQIPTLAAVWQNRITISKGTATSGTLGIKIKLVGATAYSTLLENGSAVVVNFASITEPATYVFDGDIEGWQITPTSVVGAYDISVAGH